MLHLSYKSPPILFDFKLAFVLSRWIVFVKLDLKLFRKYVIVDSNRLLGYLIRIATYAFVCQCQLNGR